MNGDINNYDKLSVSKLERKFGVKTRLWLPTTYCNKYFRLDKKNLSILLFIPNIINKYIDCYIIIKQYKNELSKDNGKKNTCCHRNTA